MGLRVIPGSGKRRGGWGTFWALFIAAVVLCACEKYTQPDTGPEGRKAILAVQTFKVPLGFTVADGVANYLYDRERKEFKVERGEWLAFKQAFPSKGYRVVYQFKMWGGEEQVKRVEHEARFLWDPETKEVEPENQLARKMMRLE